MEKQNEKETKDIELIDWDFDIDNNLIDWDFDIEFGKIKNKKLLELLKNENLTEQEFINWLRTENSKQKKLNEWLRNYLKYKREKSLINGS